MRFLTLFVPLTVMLAGCTSFSYVPYTSTEKYVYEEGLVENPQETCELGYQKVYYVVNNKSRAGGNTLLTMSNCLSAIHVDKLKKLGTVPGAPDVVGTEDETVKLIEAFRMKLPDLKQ